ncbi:MAG: copper homeostasis protein CutC [Chitinophagales bacterium]
MSITLEICVFSISDVITAATCNVDRIELCASYADGGITPSRATIEQALEYFPAERIVVMIRPRGGDFIYTDAEFENMHRDITFCKTLGIQQVIFGITHTDGTLDVVRNSTLVQHALPMQSVLQRAFDLTPDPYIALEQAIQCGFVRILTSGQAPSAPEGKEVIRTLQERSASRISILPGAGVNPGNVIELLRFTGCKEVHTSAKSYRKPVPGMRSDIYDLGAIAQTDADIIKAIQQALRNFA